MFTADKGYMLPYQPCWSSSKMKYLRGGTNFGTVSEKGLPYGGLLESMQIAGTIITAAMTTDWHADNKDPKAFLYSGGVYTIPNTDQEFNIADMEFAPGWMNRLSLFPAEADPSAPTAEEVKPTSVCATSEHEIQAAAGDGREKQKDLEFRNTFVTKFARFRTLDKVFGGNTIQFTCALREDIVPGMNLAVAVGSTANDDELYVYGYVQRIRCEIKVSGNEGLAVQTVTMTHVRNVVEQEDIVDKDYSYHFFWADAETQINAIKLWG
jgi:hypothetical protein